MLHVLLNIFYVLFFCILEEFILARRRVTLVIYSFIVSLFLVLRELIMGMIVLTHFSFVELIIVFSNF